MASSGVMRGVWAALAAVVVVLGGGAARGASAGAAVTGGHAPVAERAGLANPDAPSQECFFTFPDCTSADPTVTFVMTTGNSDSTGCTFQQDTTWGDGSDTNLTYKGGKPN